MACCSNFARISRAIVAISCFSSLISSDISGESSIEWFRFGHCCGHWLKRWRISCKMVAMSVFRSRIMSGSAGFLLSGSSVSIADVAGGLLVP